MNTLLCAMIRTYQLTLAPWFGCCCRFEPSCSRYGMEAIRLHGSIKGSWLTLKRVCRCHPGCEGGFDPVPNLLITKNNHKVS